MHFEFLFNGKCTKLKLIPSTGRDRSLLQLAFSQITSECKWSIAMPKVETETTEPYVITVTLPETT